MSRLDDMLGPSRTLQRDSQGTRNVMLTQACQAHIDMMANGKFHDDGSARSKIVMSLRDTRAKCHGSGKCLDNGSVGIKS